MRKDQTEKERKFAEKDECSRQMAKNGQKRREQMG